MRKKTEPTIDGVRAILDHDRTRVRWIVRPVMKGGSPEIVTVARIAVKYPRDGASRMSVAVTDWGPDGNAYPPAQFIGHAGGFGYDKLTAALAGATVGGVELGDDCDSRGRPTLDAVVRELGASEFRG